MPCSVGPVGAQPLLSLVTSCLPGEGAGEPRKPGAGFSSDICKRAVCPSVRPRPGMSIRCGRPRVRDGGGRGEQLRAPLAGPCPSSLTWTLFLCTFAPFVRKCNKSPMFLSPPSPWCPPQPDRPAEVQVLLEHFAGGVWAPGPPGPVAGPRKHRARPSRCTNFIWSPSPSPGSPGGRGGLGPALGPQPLLLVFVVLRDGVCREGGAGSAEGDGPGPVIAGKGESRVMIGATAGPVNEWEGQRPWRLPGQ